MADKMQELIPGPSGLDNQVEDGYYALHLLARVACNSAYYATNGDDVSTGESVPEISVGHRAVNINMESIALRLSAIMGSMDKLLEQPSGEKEKNRNKKEDNKLKKNRKPSEQKKEVDGEWIPIGGGATKVHKDRYKKVNWKSYAIATRTLLLAVFSRSVLATHSLTGKSSPAFQHKPPKMALDQRKVADVVMEVSDRFNISEGLVRNIITTKCADECKMMRMRNKKAEKKTIK